jgi:L-ascorbate metabolism protein UlaG (beta-lactamase superfamily)
LAVLHGDPAKENDVATCLSRQTSVLFIAFVPPVDAILVTH